MKGAEKAAEQIGSKTGQAIGEKVYSGITGNKGGMIIQKLLRKRGGSAPSKLSEQFDNILTNF